MNKLTAIFHWLSFWLWDEAAIPELPLDERADPLGLQADDDQDTKPIKPVDTLLCLNCGEQIELKYFGYHIEFCRLKEEFRHQPDNLNYGELPF